MDKQVYERYAQIKAQMKALEEEEAILKAGIMKELETNNADKIAFEFGKFTKSSRTSYSYSEKVALLKEKVELQQIKERDKGIAKVSVSHYLTFTPPKMN